MSGQQIGTIAGQVIGSVIYPGIGTAIGGVIGGAIGGSFDPDTINQGPRLTDLHVQTSSYGNAIPILRGTTRVAGNVIWSTVIRETLVESEEGKGGPDVVNQSFSYDLDCHIQLCEGVVLEIERIFANGVLIFDTRSGTSPQNVFANGQWARGTILYPGNETQLPDPTYEAAVGVGNASAYRGTAYIAIIGLQLTTLNTSVMPNFEFVVVQEGSIEQFIRKVAIDGLDPNYEHQTDPTAPKPRLTFDNGLIRVANDDDALVYTFDMSGTSTGLTSANEFETQRPVTYDAGEDLFGFWRMHDGTNAWAVADGTGALQSDLIIGANSASDLLGPGREFISFTQVNGGRYILAMVRDTGETEPDEWMRLEWTGGDDGELLIDETGTIDAAAAVEVFNLGMPTSGFNVGRRASFAEEDLKTIWTATGAEDKRVEIFQIDESGVLQYLYAFTLHGGGNPLNEQGAGMQDIVLSSSSRPSVYAEKGLAFIVNDDALMIYSRDEEILSDGVLLSDVVGDLCDRAGIPSAEYDVTALTQIVEGFVVGQHMTARAAIEALRPGYYFDAVDGDKLKFVNRGGAVAGTFEFLDLGAGEGDADRIVVVSQFQQETELPSRVNVRYMSKNADYQIGAQSARRETTNSQEIQNIELPVVMTDERAAEAADVNMRDSWAGSVTRSFKTGLKYSKYEPTDVVLLDDGNVVRTVRLTRRVDRGAMIEWESRDEDASVYDSNAIGMAITVPEQALLIPGPTDVEVLDLPPLTELPEGSEAAAYVAARGYLSGWNGAAIEISRDGGATYTPGTTVSVRSVMGVTLTELDDWDGGNVFDESSSVRVSVNDALSSTTRLAVLNGANAAVIGDEIVQFRTASLVSTGVYDLTGLLRARKGTEWAIDQHAIGDRFVLLTTNLRNLPLQVADRTATDLLVRAATNGTFAGSGSVEPFSTQLARLMPYSPVHLNGTRDGSDNWRLTWIRRDRYNQEWNDSIDVPMSEASKLYDVEILDGGLVVETYTDLNDEEVAVPSSVLGAVTDITFRVYQKSAVVGRGFVAETTVTQA